MKTKFNYSVLALSILFILIVSCKKEEKVFLTPFKPKSANYSQQYLNDSLAFYKIKQIFASNDFLLKEYMKAVAIGSLDLLKDTNFVNLIDSISESYNSVIGVDYYAYINDQVDNAYAAKFGRSLLDDLKLSLINNGATLYQRNLLDSVGLNFEIDGIAISPKYFLYYKNSGLYPNLSNSLPSITATLNFSDDSIPVWSYDSTNNSFIFMQTNMTYVNEHKLIDVSLRISYQRENNTGPIVDLFGNKYEALGRCKSDMTGWCTISCKWWLACCRCNRPYPRPRLTDAEYNSNDEVFF